MIAITLLRRLAAIVLLPVIAFAIWWFATANSVNPYVPPLQNILQVFPDTWGLDRLSSDVLPSVGRLVAGYALATFLGISVGVLVGSSRSVRDYLEPLLEFLRAVPPPVIVPILILFTGIGSLTKVLVIVAGCIWPILLNTVEGVRAVDAVLGDTVRCYQIRRLSRLRHLVLRSASPQIIAGMRQALSLGIILMVISEMFAASNGLGFTIVQFQRSFAIPQMWTGIIVLGIIGVVFAGGFRIFERKILGWYFGLRETQRGN